MSQHRERYLQCLECGARFVYDSTSRTCSRCKKGHLEEVQPTEQKRVEPFPAEEAEPSAEDLVLEVVAKHPEGIRLVDIGEELNLDWRGLIGPVKALWDEDRLEKVDNLYYPKA